MKWTNPDVWSNAAYIVVGYAVLLVLPMPVTAASAIFNILMAGLAVCSAHYHMGAKDGNHWDVGAMYTLGLYIWLAGAIGAPWWVALVVALPAAYWLRMKQLDVRMEVKIGALFGVVYATAFMFHYPAWPWLVGSVLIMLTAICIRHTGRYSLRGVPPDGDYEAELLRRQPKYHAIWHVLSALGLGLLWIGVSA